MLFANEKFPFFGFFSIKSGAYIPHIKRILEDPDLRQFNLSFNLIFTLKKLLRKILVLLKVFAGLKLPHETNDVKIPDWQCYKKHDPDPGTQWTLDNLGC